MKVGFAADETLLPAQIRVERLRAQTASELPPPVTASQSRIEAPDIEIDESEGEADIEDQAEAGAGEADDVPVPGETAEEGERRRRRRRRRRRSGRRDDASLPAAVAVPMPDGTEQPVVDIAAFPGARPVEWVAPIVAEANAEAVAPANEATAETAAEAGEDPATRSPRRRRGSRRKRPEEGATLEAAPAPYAGPTPADPFGGGTLDIFDVLEQAEAQHFAASAPQPEPASGVDMALAQELSQTPAILEAEAVAPIVIDPQPANEEPVAGPAIKPVVIGQGEPAAEKKRGWWRK
jgi:ribonuclease E